MIVTWWWNIVCSYMVLIVELHYAEVQLSLLKASSIAFPWILSINVLGNLLIKYLYYIALKCLTWVIKIGYLIMLSHTLNLFTFKAICKLEIFGRWWKITRCCNLRKQLAILRTHCLASMHGLICQEDFQYKGSLCPWICHRHLTHLSWLPSRTINSDTNCCTIEGGKHQRDLHQWIINNHVSELDITF